MTNTNWYDTILDFSRDTENKQYSGYEEWKKANADIIKSKEIENLEKMLEHKDRNKSKREHKREVISSKVNTQNLTTKGYQEKEISGKEIGE